MPGMERTQQGSRPLRKRISGGFDNHDIHGYMIEGPFPHDRFIVHFKYDFTHKHMGTRMTVEEMGLFTVQNGKIVKEEFFATM